MVVTQGDVFWINLPEPAGSESGYRRPYVVIQNDFFNRIALATTVVCSITSSLTHATAPGNVLLQKGDGGLPKICMVNVTQIMTIDKTWLISKLGKLSSLQIGHVLAGVQLVLNRQVSFSSSLS